MNATERLLISDGQFVEATGVAVRTSAGQLVLVPAELDPEVDVEYPPSAVGVALKSSAEHVPVGFRGLVRGTWRGRHLECESVDRWKDEAQDLSNFAATTSRKRPTSNDILAVASSDTNGITLIIGRDRVNASDWSTQPITSSVSAWTSGTLHEAMDRLSELPELVSIGQELRQAGAETDFVVRIGVTHVSLGLLTMISEFPESRVEVLPMVRPAQSG